MKMRNFLKSLIRETYITENNICQQVITNLILIIAFILVWAFALRPKKQKYKPEIEQTSIRRPDNFRGNVNPVLREYIQTSLRNKSIL